MKTRSSPPPKQVLANAERIQRLCEESYATLYDSDRRSSRGWRTSGNAWESWRRSIRNLPLQLEARDAIKSQLEDLAFFLRRYGDGIDASPARLQQVEDRLALLERLKRKYGPTLEDVIATGARARPRASDLLTQLGRGAPRISIALWRRRGTQYLESARELSRSSSRGGEVLCFARLESHLGELAMARTRFEVRFNGDERWRRDAWTERGIDQAEFFVSPNVGEDLRPLARIVSGGELSRVMLALKTMAVADGAGKTLIFDEVDAGIGGRVADVVGAQASAAWRTLSGDLHHAPSSDRGARVDALPSSRSRFEVDRTVTEVQRLDAAGRIEEISRMIGGTVPVTGAAFGPARRLMLGIEAKGKQKAKGESESR